MKIKVAINGYGRIGRNILRALYESELERQIEIVAINDLGDPQTNAHLTMYDTAHGKFPGDVQAGEDRIVVNGNVIKVFSERDPSKLPWDQLDIDVVHEATGLFASRSKAQQHLQAGAKKVLISAPASDPVDATIVYGVNHDTLKASDNIVSNASCTTNCLAPVAKVLNDNIGIISGVMVTVHAYTNDQTLTDVYHKDLRRARSATMSMIPTKTGAAVAVGQVLPELDGKLDGYAVRVPVINVSMVDLSLVTARETSPEEINALLLNAAKGPLQGVLSYCSEPLVSTDFNHDSSSSIYDATLTKVIGGNLVKIVTWYDNEWGFSNRMLDTSVALMGAK